MRQGNNGGDGFVVARTLSERGIETSVFLIGVSGDVRGDARVNLGALRALEIDVVEIADAASWELHGSDVLGADLIVDGSRHRTFQSGDRSRGNHHRGSERLLEARGGDRFADGPQRR